jgi:hypothetical protein
MSFTHPDEDGRVDLSAIDPDRDPAAADRFVATVMARVRASESRAPFPTDPLMGIWSMMRAPALAAGILIAVAVGTAGLRVNRRPAAPETIVQAIGVPAEFLADADAGPPPPPLDSR